MEKFLGKYRISSARAPWLDYTAPNDYFITICTAHHQCLFGHIPPHTAEIILSPIGKIVQAEWHKSFLIRPELCCDAFILMPNHLHAIVRINPSVETHGSASDSSVSDSSASDSQPSTNASTSPKTTHHPSNSETHNQTHCRASLQNHGIAYRPARSISSFVAGFKSAATKRINDYRNLPQAPVWQARFHDHVIRNAKAYDQIKQYIETNPQRWQQDKFYVSS